MDVYPAAPIPSYPVTITPRWKTIVSTFDNAEEQRISKHQFAVYDVTLKYNVITNANAQLLWTFYQDQNGVQKSFYFFGLTPFTYKYLYVNSGDGATLIFDLPGKGTSSRSLYVDGVLQSAGFAYLSGGGVGSADRVEFTVAPADGAIISISMYGYLRIRCRFQDDNMSFEHFTSALVRTGLNLKGLVGA